MNGNWVVAVCQYQTQKLRITLSGNKENSFVCPKDDIVVKISGLKILPPNWMETSFLISRSIFVILVKISHFKFH